MNEVRVSGPELVSDNEVAFRLQRRGEFGKAVGEVFTCRYSIPIDAVDPGILSVPLLGTLLPIAWFLDGIVRIDRVDRGFRDALPEIRAGLQSLFPQLELGGRLEADAVRSPDIEAPRERSLMLFSGGVDSVATYLRRTPHYLVTVWGGDVPVSSPELWLAVRSQVKEFADAEGATALTLRSNFGDGGFTNGTYLNHRFRPVIVNWGLEVQHGLALLSLCAPLAEAAKCSEAYIAASHTAAFGRPWGSHPKIDNRVAWSGARCFHDGYELSRAEKIRLITRHRPSVPLRVCRKGDAGQNCGVCEKCARTAVGLLVAGADPNKYGLPLDPERLVAIQQALETGRFRFRENERFMWEDLQKHAGQCETLKIDGAETFLEWFKGTSVEEWSERSARRYRFPDLVDRFVQRFLPSGMNRLLKRIYVRVSGLTGSS